jgi:PAS domain S-box-containing protein
MTTIRVAQLSTLIDAVPASIVIVDAGGKIALVNAQAEELFGYRRSELEGEMVERLVPRQVRERHSALRASFTGDPTARPMGAGRDLFGLRKDGTEFPIEIALNPIRFEEGVFIVSAIVDLSERTRQAEALRRSNEALERSNIDLQIFAQIASHDLQTPLRSIASFVELLRSTYAEALDLQAHDWLRRTSGSVSHLQTLVSDLLDYSRVDARSRPRERVSVREMLDRAVSLLDASVAESRAEITSGELPEVTVDPSQMVQLLMNLLGNAIKYRRPDAPPRIHVSAERRGDEWIFAVRDNGIGIASRHHAQIFEVFKRLHDAKEYPGTGIGLALCRRIVSRHGGRIWVESEPGEGSTFSFTIGETAASNTP